MKVPVTLFILIASQVATADFAARVAAGRSAHPSKELGDYYRIVMNDAVLPTMRGCASGANTATQDWVLTLVGTVASDGRIGDIEVEPDNAMTRCVVRQLGEARPQVPPAGSIGGSGIPLLVEIKINAAKTPPGSHGVVTPVFSQFVTFTLPAGFASVFERTTGNTYIREAVLQGESVDQWSQMITLSGTRDGALPATASPMEFVKGIANRFVDACPGTFSNKVLGTASIDGHDAFATVLGCGSVRSGRSRSEVTLIVAIKGKADMYTVQWAERTAPLSQSPSLDEAKWISRLQLLDPMRVCNSLTGEAAHPSCISPDATPPVH